MAGALRGRAAAAVAAAAGGAGFAYWDATDKRGGVGVTRAAAATATAALIVADYKWSLRGLAKDSPPFQEARHGVHERSAARLLTLCERNGGLYTKAGQFISTASGMPVPFQQQLSKLQDSARPLDWEDVRDVVVAELGAGAMANLVPGDVPGDTTVIPGDVAPRHSKSFASFDREPVAAASLAQVHRAVTSAGEEVAVKVQRPGLRRQFDVDLATMRFITGAVLVAFPNFDFSFLVPEFRDRLARELDFTWEGRSCERTGRALADDPRMVTPDIHWSLTTGKVLTMEYVRGVKVDDGAELRAAGIDPRAAAEALADTFARMLLCHGFVHGDPHPGNMLIRRQPRRVRGLRWNSRRRADDETRDLGAEMEMVTSGGWRDALSRMFGLGGCARDVQIVLLDHGLYTELTEHERRRMCRLWHAVAMRDPTLVRAVSSEMGVPESLRWVLPQLMARQTSHVSPIGTNKERNEKGMPINARSKEAAAARVDGLIRGGRPPMSMDQVSEFGKSLPREMMVVMRSNALIRNITRKLAADVAEKEGVGGSGRGLLGLSAGGFVGGDVGRRMDRRRQWAMARYSCLGVALSAALLECGSTRGGLRSLPFATWITWKLRTARVWTRIWTFRSMQYSVMLAIRALPERYSEPVVLRFTNLLERFRGGLPAA